LNATVRKYVPGVKLDGAWLFGKSATICPLAELTVGRVNVSSVTVGELPKFWPVIVSVFCV
jgi:hypothetical protein